VPVLHRNGLITAPGMSLLLKKHVRVGKMFQTGKGCFFMSEMTSAAGHL
jgi:hypothetical protein